MKRLDLYGFFKLKRISIVLGFVLSLGLISCDKINSKFENKKTNYIIIFQPFEDFPPQSLKYVRNKLVKTFPNIQINKPIDLPKEAYNKRIKRYQADSLLIYLGRRTKSGQVTIGFTREHIYTNMPGKGKYWGIFGMGFKNTRSCVASTFKLKGKNKLEKLYKLAIHEIGHTQGLNHCPNEGCYMRSAEGKDHFNSLHSFCPKCARVLNEG